MERINWEILPQFSRKEFEKLMEYSFDKKYNYLLVDKLNNTCCKNMNMFFLSNIWRGADSSPLVFSLQIHPNDPKKLY